MSLHSSITKKCLKNAFPQFIYVITPNYFYLHNIGTIKYVTGGLPIKKNFFNLTILFMEKVFIWKCLCKHSIIIARQILLVCGQKIFNWYYECNLIVIFLVPTFIMKNYLMLCNFYLYFIDFKLKSFGIRRMQWVR